MRLPSERIDAIMTGGADWEQTDDVLGVTALTRQVAGAGVVALIDLALLFVPLPLIDALLRTHPDLARDMGQAIDARLKLVAQALQDAGEPLPISLPVA